MLNLTYEERKVILFLVVLIFSGVGIDFAAKHSAQLKKVLTADRNAGKLNLNEASREDFLRLHLVSPKLADNIIAYRNEKGPLSSLDELKRVKGLNSRRIKELEKFFFLQ
jgi:competence protein ComEA